MFSQFYCFNLAKLVRPLFTFSPLPKPHPVTFLCNSFRFGYNTWRDSQRPTQVLAKLCKDIKIDPPVYSMPNKRVTVGGLNFYAATEVETEGILY